MNLTELQKADPETYKDIGQLCLYAAALPQYEIDEDSKDLPSPRIWYAIIQACLQRAIEKRGWDFTVFRQQKRAVGGEFGAITGPIGRDCSTGESPAEALLAAYLEALHAT